MDVLVVLKSISSHLQMKYEVVMYPSIRTLYLSVKSFEHRLDRFWADQPIRFNHESQIRTTSSCDIFSRILDDD